MHVLSTNPSESADILAALGQIPTSTEGLGDVVAMHLNYPSRAAQRGRRPQQPSYFLKPHGSLALMPRPGTHDDGDAGAASTVVERPHGAELLAFEGEIALIMGREARHVAPEDGFAYVAAVTAANDLGVYDLKAADKGSNLRSKGGPGFTPLGPTLLDARNVDPDNLRIRTWLNGELVQEDNTSTLLFPFGRLIADLSQSLTLKPGDVILTGTPAGSSVCEPGDVVEVEVDVPGTPELSTGRLRTTVTQGNTPFADFGARPEPTEQARADALGVASTPPTAAPLEARLREKLGRVAAATLSAQLRARGFGENTLVDVHPRVPGQKLVGTARTLRFIAQRPDLDATHGKGYNAHKAIIDSLHDGEVLVMEARGLTETGTIGDLLALRAQSAGAAGVVTDGGIRDAHVIAELGLPVFHHGTSPAVFGRRHIPWEADGVITCAGASVCPGDVIVGDDDGVVVLPRALTEEIVDAALGQERQERFFAEQIASGVPLAELYPMSARIKAAYAAWTDPEDSGREAGGHEDSKRDVSGQKEGRL